MTVGMPTSDGLEVDLPSFQLSSIQGSVFCMHASFEEPVPATVVLV